MHEAMGSGFVAPRILNRGAGSIFEFQAVVNFSSGKQRLVPIEGKETVWIPEPVWFRSKTGRFVIADFLAAQLVTKS